MSLTIQILCKNNSKTIAKTFASITCLNAEILVADLGSSDNTAKICEDHGAIVKRVVETDRSKIRNQLSEESSGEWNLLIEPWEVLIQGHQLVLAAKRAAHYCTIIQSGLVTKEIRLWRGPFKFFSPIYERLNTETEDEIGAVFYSSGNTNYADTLQSLENWKTKCPTDYRPFYYQACFLLSQGKYEDFSRISEHYMFMDSSTSMSAIMNRYYYAMAQVVHFRRVKPALQNLNLCLCAKPLMSEFWCLTGDVYYHLLNDFERAKEFYENAVILGSKRLKSDRWPMDVAKYKEYPNRMIANCDELLKHSSVFGVVRPQP